MKNGTENKKILSFRGILLSFSILLLGIIFIFLEKSGKVDAYFEKKYPQLPPVQIPPVKKYKIGFVTDAHAKTSKKTLDINIKSKDPMIRFVTEMNKQFKPDFVVDGGDFIDGTKRFGKQSLNDYFLFEKVLSQLEMPYYHIIGNHELRGMTKLQWLRLNNYNKSYYYFDLEKLRIIVLDGTLIPGSMDDPSTFEEFNRQYDWLEDTLEDAPDLKKIVFIHNSPLPILSIGLSREKLFDLTELFSRFNVKAVFSGHSEILYYEKINGVNYYSIPGFYRSKLKKMNITWFGAFSEIIFKRDIYVKLFYKEKEDGDYKIMMIPSEEYYSAKAKEDEAINTMTSEEFEDE